MGLRVVVCGPRLTSNTSKTIENLTAPKPFLRGVSHFISPQSVLPRSSRRTSVTDTPQIGGTGPEAVRRSTAPTNAAVDQKSSRALANSSALLIYECYEISRSACAGCWLACAITETAACCSTFAEASSALSCATSASRIREFAAERFSN